MIDVAALPIVLAAKRTAAKRELISTGTDKRYVRRDQYGKVQGVRGENRVVVRFRCLECDQIEEFQQLVIEHDDLLAEHKRLQSVPFSASEHTEHRR